MLNPADLMNITRCFSDEERLIQSTLAQYVDDEVLPVISSAFDEHRFPSELIPGLAELGVLGCYLDGYECAGLNATSYGLICQELERGDSALRSFVSVQTSLVMWPIYQYGSEEQKQRWLPALAKAEAVGCFGLTESHGGSDPNAMKSYARKQGNEWILNGSKMWITNGSIADIALIWAHTDEGVKGFLLETDIPGFEAKDIQQKFSLRASVTSELFFDNVHLPLSAELPLVDGLKSAFSCLNHARFGISWGAIGAAIACFKEVLDFSQSRILFERPLAHTQAIQLRLADMGRRISAAQLLAYQLAQLKQADELTPVQISLVKLNNVRAAIDIARDARDMLGASGITLDHCVIRHMLNLESVITYEGTETIHQLVIGRELTGQSAF